MFASLSSDVTSFPFSFLFEKKEKRIVSIHNGKFIQIWEIYDWELEGIIII